MKKFCGMRNENSKRTYSFKKGFTLAETLITIGIIGVTSVLVIPPIINKYKEIVTVNKVKKFYSMISQAMALSILENGSPQSWSVSESQGVNFIYTSYVKPYVKINEDCVNNTGSSCSLQVSSNLTYLNGEKWEGTGLNDTGLM